jgi:hypothetical protein
MFCIFSEKCYELKIASGRVELMTAYIFSEKCSELKNCWRGESNLVTVSYIQKQRTEKQPVEIVGRAQQQPGVCGSWLATDQVGVKHLPGPSPPVVLLPGSHRIRPSQWVW